MDEESQPTKNISGSSQSLQIHYLPSGCMLRFSNAVAGRQRLGRIAVVRRLFSVINR
jgi:hypothetical protein